MRDEDTRCYYMCASHFMPMETAKRRMSASTIPLLPLRPSSPPAIFFSSLNVRNTVDRSRHPYIIWYIMWDGSLRASPFGPLRLHCWNLLCYSSFTNLNNSPQINTYPENFGLKQWDQRTKWSCLFWFEINDCSHGCKVIYFQPERTLSVNIL